MQACAGMGFASSEPIYQKTQDHIATGPYQSQPLPPTTHKPYLLVNFALKNCILKVINSNSLLSFEYKTHKLLLSFVAPWAEFTMLSLKSLLIAYVRRPRRAWADDSRIMGFPFSSNITSTKIHIKTWLFCWCPVSSWGSDRLHRSPYSVRTRLTHRTTHVYDSRNNFHQWTSLLSLVTRCMSRSRPKRTLRGGRGGGKEKKKIATTKTISGIQLQQTKNTHLVYREGSPTLPMLFTSPVFTFFTSLMQDAQKKKKKSHNKK